ncbi:hypothetical protein DL766_005983 [Monosporascus sp. MC13-8B]|uniref:Uncharacterized protein n=1 Tax=Monosporascus cannonballus TaxID=155416 RepID=A0ABY0H7J5_9PEZI|nr:hypothetical protein DL762_004490 [Monosporascus cannonballus]RYO94696.1 hypothetical protein DL763_003970 [Monosporascus cannonballus]RYP28238.1 hypothetical protein DL766_005983 [Monosporascus sp. MC13-8B]
MLLSSAQCRFIVVIDTYDRIGPQARLKKGQVTAQGARDFVAYKSNAKKLILSEVCQRDETCNLGQSQGQAEYGYRPTEVYAVDFLTNYTGDKHVTFVEPSRRLGFGLAVRTALRLTETPYVWIQQHDWALDCDIPLGPILDIMETSLSDQIAPVKYVCFPSVRMLSYATSAHVMGFPTLRELTASLKGDFVSASHPNVKVPLTPLFFWHDKPHVASTAHYLSCVFPTPLALPRGAFIEDTVGQRARNQMKQGVFAKWACWLYYPKEGTKQCLRHLQGRTWRGAEGELAQREAWKKLNARRAADRRD